LGAHAVRIYGSSYGRTDRRHEATLLRIDKHTLSTRIDKHTPSTLMNMHTHRGKIYESRILVHTRHVLYEYKHQQKNKGLRGKMHEKDTDLIRENQHNSEGATIV
jgi:hypothetical protein